MVKGVVTTVVTQLEALLVVVYVESVERWIGTYVFAATKEIVLQSTKIFFMHA